MSLADESTYTNALQSVAKIVSVYLEQSAELKPDQLVSLVENVLNVLHQRAPAKSNGADAVTAGDTSAAPPSDVPPVAASKPLTPAVPVDQSVMPDYLVCLEDGNKVKLLKRYLRSKYDLTPRQYREKWGLPKDYPMVAPSYSAKRTAIARASGLGARRPDAASNGAAPAPVEAAPVAKAEATPAKPKSPAKTTAPKRSAAAPAAAAPVSAAPKKAVAAKKTTPPAAEAAPKPPSRSKRK